MADIVELRLLLVTSLYCEAAECRFPGLIAGVGWCGSKPSNSWKTELSKRASVGAQSTVREKGSKVQAVLGI